MVFPATSEFPSMRTRKRLTVSPYSLTSSSSDFPLSDVLSDLRFFVRNHLLSGSSAIMPTATQTRPTGRKVKNDSLSNPASARVSLMIRLGGVPMSVIIPPMLLANASGISRRLGFALAMAAMLTTMGSISATVPVLLTKAPMHAVVSTTSRKSRSSLLPASLSILLLIIFARPVWKIPPPTMNRPTIIITVEFEKPERPSSGVRIWNTSSASSAQSATRSDRTFPVTKKMIATARIAMVIHIVRSF